MVAKEVKLWHYKRVQEVSGRLVGQTQIPPNLSPVYIFSCSSVSGVSLDRIHGELRIGSQ